MSIVTVSLPEDGTTFYTDNTKDAIEMLPELIRQTQKSEALLTLRKLLEKEKRILFKVVIRKQNQINVQKYLFKAVKDYQRQL